MTIYKKVLTSTLLATSVLAFNANASDEYLWDDQELGEVRVIMSAAEETATAAVDATEPGYNDVKSTSPVKVYVTTDLVRIPLPIQKTKTLNILMDPAAPAARNPEGKQYTGKKYNIITTAPASKAKDLNSEFANITKNAKVTAPAAPFLSFVEFYNIATHPEDVRTTPVAGKVATGGSTDVELVSNRAQDDVARKLDFISAELQLNIGDARTAKLSDEKALLDWSKSYVTALEAAYQTVLKEKVSKYNFSTATSEDYYAALLAVKEIFDASRPVSALLNSRGADLVSSSEDATYIAKAALPNVSPALAVDRQEVTKQGLFSEMAATSVGAVYDIPSEDAVTLVKAGKEVQALQREVVKLNDEVLNLWTAVQTPSMLGKTMWTYFKVVLDGKYVKPAVVIAPEAAPVAPEAAPAAAEIVVDADAGEVPLAAAQEGLSNS
jgi:hypothetical protein